MGTGPSAYKPFNRGVTPTETLPGEPTPPWKVEKALIFTDYAKTVRFFFWI